MEDEKLKNKKVSLKAFLLKISQIVHCTAGVRMLGQKNNIN
jgi:hypothetical protein